MKMIESISASAREKYNKAFPKKHSLVIAIHAKETKQVLENVKIAYESGADGAFLVDHDGSPYKVMEAYYASKIRYHNFWMGVNILEWSPVEHFQNGRNCDGFRVDNPCIGGITVGEKYDLSGKIDALRSGFRGLYFGGVEFKHQPLKVSLENACKASLQHIDVLTTSGSKTGMPASIEQIINIRNYIGDFPMALASGVDLTNIEPCFGRVDCFVVNSSISDDFYKLNPKKTEELVHIINTNN